MRHLINNYNYRQDTIEEVRKSWNTYIDYIRKGIINLIDKDSQLKNLTGPEQKFIDTIVQLKQSPICLQRKSSPVNSLFTKIEAQAEASYQNRREE